MTDIVISYTKSDGDWTKSDGDWAYWFAGELKELGHRPHIHEWEIKGGTDIYAWMEAQHDAADHVLCASRTSI
jgi:TIR domain